MLLKIREKSQGIFAWVILILICVPFALWGIQNYLGGGKEAPIATVGDKEFYQQDLNRAYAQYAQNLAGRDFDEQIVKQQAFEKLISDEVLLQYVVDEGLVVADDTARAFIKSLEYFQTDGEFDKQKYKSLLAAQRMPTSEFVNRIRKALIMDQFQKAVTQSSFATQAEIDNFFAIQNQKRDFDYITVPLKTISESATEEEIQSYYQQNQGNYQTEEQIKIEYVELSLDGLAKDVDFDDQQLMDFYEERKDLYTTKERRKISHMLFLAKDGEEEALKRAESAKLRVSSEDFAKLAQTLSDDGLTAKNGGDLGLFNAGDMEPAFDEAVMKLQLGEVSEPVKSSFGYHLIKVTELVPGDVKPFESVKAELTSNYKRAQAENKLVEMGEMLAEVSYENPDSLLPVADALGVEVKQNGYFTKLTGEGVAEQDSVRGMAFSEDVLKGNNSDLIELSDRIVVLRMLDYKPAATKPLEEVKTEINLAVQSNKAKAQTKQLAETIKEALKNGDDINALAEQNQLTVESKTGLTRNSRELPWMINQAVFKAAKPTADKPTIVIADKLDGSQAIVKLTKVEMGAMSESDKQKQSLAEMNISRAFGQSLFAAVLSGLKEKAEVSVLAQQQ